MAALRERGGVMSLEDLSGHRTAFVDPISTTYPGPPSVRSAAAHTGQIHWSRNKCTHPDSVQMRALWQRAAAGAITCGTVALLHVECAALTAGL